MFDYLYMDRYCSSRVASLNGGELFGAYIEAQKQWTTGLVLTGSGSERDDKFILSFSNPARPAVYRMQKYEKLQALYRAINLNDMYFSEYQLGDGAHVNLQAGQVGIFDSDYLLGAEAGYVGGAVDTRGEVNLKTFVWSSETPQPKEGVVLNSWKLELGGGDVFTFGLKREE